MVHFHRKFSSDATMLSMDFVVELPLFSRYDTVMTVVDSVSK